MFPFSICSLDPCSLFSLFTGQKIGELEGWADAAALGGPFGPPFALLSVLWLWKRHLCFPVRLSLAPGAVVSLTVAWPRPFLEGGHQPSYAGRPASSFQDWILNLLSQSIYSFLVLCCLYEAVIFHEWLWLWFFFFNISILSVFIGRRQRMYLPWASLWSSLHPLPARVPTTWRCLCSCLLGTVFLPSVPRSVPESSCSPTHYRSAVWHSHMWTLWSVLFCNDLFIEPIYIYLIFTLKHI